jgi:hypothetical protein
MMGEGGMSNVSDNALPGAIGALRRFNRPRVLAEAHCDLCAAPLAPDHQHLLDPAARQVSCACDACAILFSSNQAGRLRRIPRRIECWADFQLDEVRWSGLGIPIGLAFFYRSTAAGQVISAYPSPAGATEVALAGEPWQGLIEANPALGGLEADVEALLVNRMDGARQYYRVPIDECYKLVGLVRMYWRGLSGGDDFWQRLGDFFVDLQGRATEGTAHA